MKQFIALSLFLFFGVLSAQSFTEKYNSLTSQYEYYNASNQIVGYKKYNSLLKQWEYYEAQQRTSYQPPVDENFELQAKVALAREDKYNQNKKRLQTAVNDIYEKTRNMHYSENVKTSAITSFIVEYIDVLNSKNYDLSYDNVTDQLISWLYGGIQTVMKREIDAELSNSKEENTERDKNLAELNYYSGGYTTTEVVEEKYNPFTKQYEFVKRDNSLSKIYIENGKIFYFRNHIGAWKLIAWKYFYSDTENHTLNDTVGFTLITVNRALKFVEFLEEPVGGVFSKKYTYKGLRKDSTISKPF